MQVLHAGTAVRPSYSPGSCSASDATTKGLPGTEGVGTCWVLPLEKRFPASELIYLRVEGCSLYRQGMCAALEGANFDLYALHLLTKLIKAICNAAQVLSGRHMMAGMKPAGVLSAEHMQ